jgi:hypothetical protein
MMKRKRDGDSTTETTHKHETAGWSRSGGTWCELSQIIQISFKEHNESQVKHLNKHVLTRKVMWHALTSYKYDEGYQ